MKAADLVDTLKGPGPFTVFAPTDQAFNNLPPGALEVLLKPENKEQLRSILTYHVDPGRVTASDVVKLTSAKTANGQEVRISVLKGVVRLNDARVTKTDVAATNGVIHVIDRVIVPPMGEISQVAKIDDMLAAFESKAIETRRNAAILESKRRNTKLSWETHAEKLNLIKEQVNELGEELDRAGRYAIDPQAPIRIVVENGNVELQGVVDSKLDKQMAHTQASSVPGVFSVKNNLLVASEMSR